MKLETIAPAKGATHARKRIGRGEGSGHGGTSTRGMNGAGQRSGYSHKIGFEGGQMPLQRRLPKFGFKNINRVEYKAINLDLVQALADSRKLQKIGIEDFRNAGYISRSQLVKVLANGAVTSALTIEANAFSAAAQKAIEAAGGTITKV